MDRKGLKPEPLCGDCRGFENIGHDPEFDMRQVGTKASVDLNRAALMVSKVGWWWREGDLNSRPIDYESIALTN